MRNLLSLLLCLICSGTAAAKAPTPPSDLRVKALGVNSFRLDWKDRSKNETGFRVEVSLNSSFSSPLVINVPLVDITSYVVLTNDLRGKAVWCRVSAYNGVPGSEKPSKPSNTASAEAFAQSSFGAPLKLKAKTLDDGRIQLTWKDFSTSEEGYQIEFRDESGKWKLYSNINPDVKFKLETGLFLPGKDYSFRVRAFKQTPAIFTQFSNITTASTRPFQAPSNLVATPASDGALSLKWKDQSSLELGFEIESRSGTGAFSKLGEVETNVTSTDPITGFAFGATFQLRLRAFRLVDGLREYSQYSPVASVKIPLMANPTNLAAATLSDTAVKLSWKHDSARELGFQIQYRETGSTDFLVAGNAPANAKDFTISGLLANSAYQFRVRAFDFFAYSAFSTVAQATTKGGIIGSFNPPIIVGKRFRYPIQTSLPGLLTNVTVTGLPAGLVYNAASRTITGTLTVEGVSSVTLTATFSDGTTSTRTLTLRSISGLPIVASSFSSVNVAAAAQKTVSVNGRFADPDTTSAARFTTTKGVFDVILYAEATPATVNNFVDYIDAGLYDNMFFHRSPPNFVVQGGGFRHTTAGGYSRVATFPAVVNEPGLSNIRGTVAMAKLPDLPISATSEFFVNMVNNASNLDAQNGGFTVFGRVPNSGMQVLDVISDLPTGDYSVQIGATPTLLEDLPVDAVTAPPSLAPSNLVKVTSVDASPILVYEVISQNPAVATVALVGTNIIITGVAAGSTSITVRATDLDGQNVTQFIPVTVP